MKIKPNTIKIADEVYFRRDLNGVLVKGEKITLSKESFDLLECIVDAKGRYVTAEYILETVWDGAFDLKSEDKLIANALVRLRKAIGDTKKDIIVTTRGVGYKLALYQEIGDVEESGRKIPLVVTNSIVQNANDENVLFREAEKKEIIEHLQTKHTKAILLHGFAGVGKTSIARLVFSTIKENYDATGWIEYHLDTKNSFVESIEWSSVLPENVDEYDSVEKKWVYISNLFKNTKEKKLLVIDNVDIDHEIGQNPDMDVFLADVSGWTNTDVILTSRLPEIKGYHSIHIDNLGDEENVEYCVKLFYHYNREAKKIGNDEIIEKIVSLAGFNTKVIEILARSCVYEDSLESYYSKLVSVGFTYPKTPIMTVQDKLPDIAINQLTKLFGVRKRTDVERLIVTSFRLLPDGERVSRSELEDWLGYDLGEIDPLVKEGWVEFRDGRFSVHSLIRGIILLTQAVMKEYRKSIGVRQRMMPEMKTLEQRLSDHSLFFREEEFEKGLRKLVFSDALSFPQDHLSLYDLIYIGDYARFIGRRDLALKYYKLAYERTLSDVKGKKIAIKDVDMIWKSVYYYGYLLSYSKSGLADAEILMRKALSIAQKMSEDKVDDHAIVNLATSYDHLGYVLANGNSDDLNTLMEAQDMLEQAIDYRKSLCDKFPDETKHLHDLAWSLDNMGCLLTMIGALLQKEQHEDCIDYLTRAEECLEEALKIREEFVALEQDIKADSEVAWTCCNLAYCLGQNTGNLVKAEKLFVKSLELYEKIGERTPGLESSSVARTYAAYARVLSLHKDRYDDTIETFSQALELNKRLERGSPGVYLDEISSIEKDMNKHKGTKVRKKG